MEISAPDFDLEKTLDSGQVFHWEKAAKGFVGTIGDCAIYIEQGPNVLAAWNNEEKLDGAKPSSLQRLIANYFALDHPCVISERSGYQRGTTLLSRPTNHSPAEMGMPGYVHLFVDETGGTYSSDLTRAPATLWSKTESR